MHAAMENDTTEALTTTPTDEQGYVTRKHTALWRSHVSPTVITAQVVLQFVGFPL